MPGIQCSVFDPAGPSAESRWRRGMDMLRHHPEHIQEQYSEPGFRIACVYHPEVCKKPRLLVTPHHVLAAYGTLHDDDLRGADGEALCQALLERFLQGGAARLQHLNGRYDIAVWNRRSRVLQWVSDRFGANRHYSLRQHRALHFACEVKSLAPWLDRIEVEPAGLVSMLSFGYHLGDLTLLRGVRRLPNACHLEYRAADHAYQVDRYWTYPFGETEPLRETEDELAEALHGQLKTALQRQLRGVDSILLPLSGGLDSRSLAELLRQCGFAGEVLAYSYGQPTSRDVRFGRAIARKLRYRHLAIPTPADFITRHLEDAAWQFDAEWSGELNWTNFAHAHPGLGNTHGMSVLSGMYGDAVMGEILRYRPKSPEEDILIENRKAYFLARHQEYLAPSQLDEIFHGEAFKQALAMLDGLVDSTFDSLRGASAYYAQVRAQFEHRVRRHTAMVAQCLETSHPAITPFLDRDVVDFTARIPFALFRDKTLYKRMIRNHLPVMAALPYSKTGMPLRHGRLSNAWHWRKKQVLKRLGTLRAILARRNAFFDFEQHILGQHAYFESRAGTLRHLTPLIQDTAQARYRELLSGRRRPADQLCALVTPACYLERLRHEGTLT